MIYTSWTQLERYPGNPKLEQECWTKTFYDPREDENVDVYVFGFPGSYFYTNSPKSIGYGYTMGAETIEEAKAFVDHVYHSFYDRIDITSSNKVKETEFFF
jgi:hypothetical protein